MCSPHTSLVDNSDFKQIKSKLHTLRLLSIDCHSLKSQEERNQLAALLICNDVDVVFACETYLDESIYLSKILPKLSKVLKKIVVYSSWWWWWYIDRFIDNI